MTGGVRPIRLVIADDEQDVRLVLAMQLDALADFEVVGDAADGQEALEACRRLRPDAVVMDLLMPVVTGFEAIERLQREMPEIGIVAYTGVAGEFVRAEMQRLSIPLVLKSGEITALATALRRVVARAEADTD